MIDVAQADAIRAAIDPLVGVWSRIAPWLGRDEIVQVAWVAALEVLRRHDPATGAFGPYVRSAVRDELWNYVTRSRCPASVGHHRNLSAVVGIECVDVADVQFVDDAAAPDRAVASAAWRRRAERDVAAALAALDECARAAALHLLACRAPRDAVRVSGLRMREVIADRRRATRLLRRSDSLRALREDRP